MEQNQDLAFTLIMKQMMNEGIIKKILLITWKQAEFLHLDYN